MKIHLGLRTYLFSIFQRRNSPSKKFVIFGQPRSGTTLLVSALNSHPDIHCDGELLQEKILFPKQLITGRASMCSKNVYGFKLLMYQLTSVQNLRNPGEFLQSLNGQGYFFIHVSRRNLFRRQISNLIAYTSKIYHHKVNEGQGSRKKISIDPNRLLVWMEKAEAGAITEAEVLMGIPHLDIVYEDNLENYEALQASVNRIADHFSLPRVAVKTDMVKDTPRELTEVIENYSEVVDAVGRTRFAEFINI